MDKHQLIHSTEELMKKSIDKFVHELSTIRTGRASASLLDTVKVDCYNTSMLLNQVASVTVRDAKTIEIRPWDATILPLVEKGILKSSVGITPVNDGKIIRLVIPPLTEERRKDIVKQCGKMAEEFHVSIRNERRISLETIKKLEKEKQITEDEKFKLEDDLQKLTNQYIIKVDELLSAKNEETMQV